MSLNQSESGSCEHCKRAGLKECALRSLLFEDIQLMLVLLANGAGFDELVHFDIPLQRPEFQITVRQALLACTIPSLIANRTTIIQLINQSQD